MTERSASLTPHEIRKFDLAKSFTDHTSKINSVSFSRDGKLLVCASDSDEISVYNVENGKRRGQKTQSGKYGCNNITFTHQESCILYSSNKNLGKHVDNVHALRYQSLHDNKYIRYLTGHTQEVTSLAMSPIDDTVLSSSKDRTVRIWDLRNPQPVGMLDLSKSTSPAGKRFDEPVVAIDPMGLIFAVGTADLSTLKGYIKLYDIEQFDRGPFDGIEFNLEARHSIISIKFSPDGKQIMACTNGQAVYVISAYPPYKVNAVLKGFSNTRGRILQGGWTPEAQYCYVCDHEGKVHWWKCSDFPRAIQMHIFRPEVILKRNDKYDAAKRNEDLFGRICGPIHAAAFNPIYCMFASGGEKVLNFWIPDLE